MYWGSGATSILVGIVGGVLIVCAVVLGRRLGGRRAVGLAGLGLLLVGLTLSGLVDVIASIAFNPVRWVGVAAIGVGVLMLLGSGMLSRRGRSDGTTEASTTRPDDSRRAEVGRRPASEDEGMDEIEEILRRRGIT